MFYKNVILKSHSHYQIGGPACYFFEAKNVDDLIKAVHGWRRDYSDRRSDAIFILGEGTNVLFDDNGFDGLVLKPNIPTLKRDDCLLTVGAGVSMFQLLDYSMTKSLSGLEWAGGLPGTLGGAIYGNAGAFGGEIKDLAVSILSLDISGSRPKIIKRKNEDCDFGYRSSVFKKNGSKEIILEATLLLKKGHKKAIRESVEEKIKYRKERQPLEYPNIGSIFKNVPLTQIYAEGARNYAESLRKSAFSLRGSATPVKTDPFPLVPTAHLIHEAGLKGVSFGGAMISPKHPNFIVNVLDAASSDVKKLIELVKRSVYGRFGIEIEEEVVIL
ncbi:UDP-N-acetylmuramate dehydrogenase [Candidatus Wolfebacteria bacterium]|nr:UDP-N-acetylmuramate dehydrogenase [Candidatus Wolfebacteria bacterium]